GGALTYARTTNAAHGNVVVNADGTFTYTPTANYHGADSFTYTVTDAAAGETATNTVTFTVTSVNRITATKDSFTTAEDTAIADRVATNDSTTSGGALTYARTTNAAHGNVVVNADGTFTYTPTANYNGNDSFTYTVTDAAAGESATKTVSLTVTSDVDLAAENDTFTTSEDTPLSDSVATNDSTTSG